MKKHRIALITAAVALAGVTSSAFAIEGTQEFRDTAALSTKSRADVVAELRAAQRDGTAASYDEASPAPVAQSTVSRGEVVAALRAAQRDGTLDQYNEASPEPVAQSTMTRAQVLAELREAQRLGVVPYGDPRARAETAADAQAIRVAGEQARAAELSASN